MTDNSASAFERDVRNRIARKEALGLDSSTMPLDVLRGLIKDIEMWREIVKNDIDKWGFDALVMMAKRILDEIYPEMVFTGVNAEKVALEIVKHLDPAGTIRGIPQAAEAIVKLLNENSGVRFVVMLRQLIAEIEKT